MPLEAGEEEESQRFGKFAKFFRELRLKSSEIQMIAKRGGFPLKRVEAFVHHLIKAMFLRIELYKERKQQLEAHAPSIGAEHSIHASIQAFLTICDEENRSVTRRIAIAKSEFEGSFNLWKARPVAMASCLSGGLTDASSLSGGLTDASSLSDDEAWSGEADELQDTPLLYKAWLTMSYGYHASVHAPLEPGDAEGEAE